MQHKPLYGLVFFEGRWRYEVVRADGTVRRSKWLLNGVTTPALSDLMEVYFRSGTQKPNWYAGLINSAQFSTLSAADTISSHAGWSEFTGYSESTRPQWSPAAASSGRLLNTSAMTFTFSQPATVYGLFLVSESTKGGITGTLWSTAPFDSEESLLQGELLRVYYDLTAAPGAG